MVSLCPWVGCLRAGCPVSKVKVTALSETDQPLTHIYILYWSLQKSSSPPLQRSSTGLIWYQHHWSSAGFNSNQITITIILIGERHRRVWKWWDEDLNYPDQDQDRHYCRPLARNALSKTTDSLDLGCAESESERQKTLWEKVKVDGW